MLEEPVITKNASAISDEVITHPAFGQIAISRVSGNTRLYCSDFNHQYFIALTIAKSQSHRRSGIDHPMMDEQLIEVYMSESQWATLVSSMNTGNGVPCTLSRIGANRIAGIPSPPPVADRFDAKFKEGAKAAVEALDAMINKIDSLGLSKTKAEELKSEARKSKRTMEDSLPWLGQVFSEHMENATEKAKAEIHGYASANAIQQITGGDVGTPTISYDG